MSSIKKSATYALPDLGLEFQTARERKRGRGRLPDRRVYVFGVRVVVTNEALEIPLCVVGKEHSNELQAVVRWFGEMLNENREGVVSHLHATVSGGVKWFSWEGDTLTEMSDPDGPRRISDRTVEINLTGCLYPAHQNRDPVLLQMTGAGDDLFWPVFTTAKRLAEGMSLANTPYARIMQIDDGREFFQSVEDNERVTGVRLRMALDCCKHKNGRIRFHEVFMDAARRRWTN